MPEVGTLQTGKFGREFSEQVQAEVRHIRGTEWEEVLAKIQDLEAQDYRVIGRNRGTDSSGRKLVSVTKEEAMSAEEKKKLTGRTGIVKISGVYYVDMAPKAAVIPQDENKALLEL